MFDIPTLSDDGLPEARALLERLRRMLEGDETASLMDWEEVDEQAREVLEAPVYAEMRAIPFFQRWPWGFWDKDNHVNTLWHWRALAPDIQQAAVDGMPAWLALTPPGQKLPCSAVAYLVDRKWQDAAQ